MQAETDALADLENGLWTSETRFDRESMNDLLTLDFVEFGKSGRRYNREEVLHAEDEGHAIVARLHDLECHPITEDVALVTYVCELDRGGQAEWSNRSSLWQHLSGRWRLRFHQGTPTEALQ